MSEARKFKASIRERLYGNSIFFPLRAAYQFLFDRAKLLDRLHMRSFFAQFIRPGSLVFDVGAHLGKYTECFTSLGARVVAIEPNPSCCRILRKLARSRDVHVENFAVGERPGKLNLHICVEYPSISTVADEWYEAAKSSPLQHGSAHWCQPLEVEARTLDQFAERYGIPSFVKIDVEGFDDQVLRGMSFRPRALSFEFNKEVPQVALRCLEAPVLADGYEFNYTCGAKLTAKQWMNSEQLRNQIFNAEKYFGDVLARQTTSSNETITASGKDPAVRLLS